MKSLKFYKKGVTLPEVLTVIAIVVLVTVVSMPAIDTFFDSMASQGSAEAMISAALSSARAMATSEHRYVGIRFQNIYDERGPLYADQYMIFIVYDYDKTNLANGFMAVDGIKPMKLPENIGVMDLRLVVDRNQNDPVNPFVEYRIDDPSVVNKDDLLSDLNNIRDTTTFSIIFSPSGKLVIQGVRVRIYNDIFNTLENVDEQLSMFVVDDYFEGNLLGNQELGFGPEPSRRKFWLYDRREFRRAYNDGRPVTGYLGGLTPLYINPYTGTIISQGN